MTISAERETPELAKARQAFEEWLADHPRPRSGERSPFIHDGTAATLKDRAALLRLTREHA